MARRTILAVAAGLLLMLGAAHVYLHPTLQTTAHEDDTIARLEKLHQALAEKTSMQEKSLASYKATTLAAQDAMKAQANPTTSSCLLYTSPSPRDLSTSRMPSSA